MSSWGCGPQIIGKTLLSAIIIYSVQYIIFPDFKINIPQNWALIIGSLWFILGIPIWLSGAKTIGEAYPAGKLATEGIFRYIQHPIYSAFTLFYIPGFIFMSRSWLGFITPFLFYYFFRRSICFEESYLKEKFGEKYLIYKNKTGRIIPKYARK